jgi:hypothetical protein
MSSHPAGTVSNRRKAAAIRLLSTTVDDESAPLYLRVQSARTLLQQQKEESKPAEDDGEFPRGGGGVIILKPGEVYDPAAHSQSAVILPSKVVILPSNGRELVAEDRERQRLARLAALPLADDDEPEPLPEVPVPPAPVKKLSGRERLRLLRAKRKAMREAEE